MGRVISRKYEELGQLGQGGQGVVYKVRHVEHQTVMALKALPAYLLEDQDMVARFEQESVVMTRLQHRNIARVLGTGRDDTLNLTYFVMEYIEGRTLKQYLYDKGPLPLPEVIEIARQVASALAYAHTQTPPVIHRDIKPTNIMIEDHTGRVVVLDFGIAKELDDGESRTKTGVMVGTWKYCSPEQLRHEPLSGSADVYSLGIVMYEILTGKQFFAGLDEHAVLGKVLYDPQENIPAFDRPVPPAFAAVVTKAIAKDRDKRYPRMADLSRDLEACWLVLDETKTVALFTPPPAVSQPVQERSEIEKIEAQIRQLEEERQRRVVTSLQSQVREARTRAEQEGARQVAAALFEQGLAQEGAGEEHVRHRQYALAQQPYQEALQSFARAAEEAVSAVLWRQAEQNRQEAANASADADRYLAQTRAAAAYTSARATHARAEHAWEQRQYAEAGALYVEARDLFEDARDLAYRQTLKEEAEAARSHAHASKQAAVSDSAETLASSLFEEGRANEQRATGALEREEFTQAREFFLTAQQKYEQAQRQAQRAQQRRQEVIALAGDVEAAQLRAQAEGPEVREQKGYQQAEQFRQQAETLLAANEFTGAEQRFTQAREQYEAAARVVAGARLQQQVTRVRREADTARAGAEAADAQRWCPTEWTAGQHADEVGRSQETQGELAAAIESYRQAGQHWEQVRQTALARSTQAQAETVRQRLHTVKKQAQPLRPWADAQWQAAHEHETQGDAARQAGDYGRAAAEYAQAEGDYDRARTDGAERQRQEAEEQRVREQARIAKERTRSAQTEALQAGAQELVREVFDEARIMMQQAESALSAEEFLAAAEAYRAAEAQYHQAREHAQTESRRRDTVTSAQLTETTRQRAAAFGKQSETNPSYRQARERHQHAEQRFQAREYVPAKQAYEQARALYEAVIREAERELRRTVTQAREATVKARQGAERHEAPQRVADQWAVLLEAEHHAQASEAGGESAAAIKAWQELEVQYVHIREMALEHAALERVTLARQQVQVAKEDAQEWKPWAASVWGEAVHQETAAERALQARKHGEAEQGYRNAALAYARVKKEGEIAQHAAHETLRQHAVRAQQAAIAARVAAERGGAREEAVAHYRDATVVLQQGDALVTAQQYEQARQRYRQAQEGYEEAARVAEERRRQHAVMEARQRAETARHAAEQAGAVQRFSSTWQDANRVLQRAQHHEAQSEWQEAAALYEDGAQQFSRLRHEAEQAAAYEEEQRQRRAHLARQRATQSQQTTERGEGPRVAHVQYATAMQAYQAGERDLAARQWENAEASFDRAHDQFLALATLVQKEQDKRLATTTREEALNAHQEMQQSRASELFPQEVARIDAVLREGEQAFARTEFAPAHQQFLQGIDQLKQLARATVRQVQKERAEQVKAQALTLQSQLSTAKGAQHKQAKKAVQQGEQLFAREQYQEATASYETAVTLWTALQQAAAMAAVAQESSPPAHQNGVAAIPSPEPRARGGYAIIGGVAAILLVGLYFVNPFRETSLRETIQQPETPLVKQEAPRTKAIEAKPEVSSPTVKPQPPVPIESPKIETARAPVPEKLPPPAPKPLRIARATPDPAAEVVVKEGGQQPFTIVTDNATSTALRYAWQVNGKEVSVGMGQEAATWAYRPGFDEGGEQPKTVEVVVTDEGQQSARKRWSVRVQNSNRAPRLLTTSPRPGKPLMVRAGEVKDFAIEASDPDKDDRLAYVWSLDGKEVARENRWQFHIPPSGGAHTVTVTVSDQGGATLKQEWLLSLKTPPPTITKTIPATAREVEAEEGKPVTFAVVADSAGKGALRYAWRVDGRAQSATGAEWTYSPGFADGTELLKRVEVRITDSDDQTVTETWRVRVREVNQPPRIVRVSPDAERAVEMTTGVVQEFTVNATDPDRDDRLAYVWSLDGEEVARSERWRFHAPATAGSHQVRVEIQDREGMKQQQVWQVLVKAVVPPPEPSVTIAARPREVEVPPPSVPGKTELREAEVQEWLEENYRRPWESKNTDHLVSVGLLSTEGAINLKQVLAGYREFRVALSDVDIQTQGTQATVSFNRVDTMDRNTVAHPNRTTILLEKRGDGRIVVRK